MCNNSCNEDCVECCGYEYANYTLEERLDIAAKVLGIPAHSIAEQLAGVIKEKHPLS
jgi:hypothetical protein